MKCRLLCLDNSRYCTGWAVLDIDTDNKQYHEGMNIVDYGYIDTHTIREEGKTLIHIEQRCPVGCYYWISFARIPHGILACKRIYNPDGGARNNHERR